jgi:hypothetical protein
MLAKMVPSPWIDVQVLLALFLMLGGSAAMFAILVRRWESHRPRFALEDWGAEHGFKLQPLPIAHPPAPLAALRVQQFEVRQCLTGDGKTLIEFQTEAVRQPDGRPGITGNVVWRVLIQQLGSSWHPTGLRPAEARSSLLDLISLSSFPLLGPTERFIVFGTDSIAARALSASMTRSLLPPDIGLLLYGNHLLIDFSDRPFDQIEFNRMLSLAEQVGSKLPTGDARARGTVG